MYSPFLVSTVSTVKKKKKKDRGRDYDCLTNTGKGETNTDKKRDKVREIIISLLMHDIFVN